MISSNSSRRMDKVGMECSKRRTDRVVMERSNHRMDRMGMTNSSSMGMDSRVMDSMGKGAGMVVDTKQRISSRGRNRSIEDAGSCTALTIYITSEKRRYLTTT